MAIITVVVVIVVVGGSVVIVMSLHYVAATLDHRLRRVGGTEREREIRDKKEECEKGRLRSQRQVSFRQTINSSKLTINLSGCYLSQRTFTVAKALCSASLTGFTCPNKSK